MRSEQKKTEKEPEQLHQEQTWGSILIPVLVITLVCVAVFVLLLVFNSGEFQATAQWANISIMFMILPMSIVGLVILAIVILVAYLTRKWNRDLPPGLKLIRLQVLIFNQKIQNAVQKTTIPVIGIKSFITGITSIFRK